MSGMAIKARQKEKAKSCAPFWDCLLETLFAAEGKASQWQLGWLNTEFINGEPFRESNPICSAINTNAKRGIRIIQEQCGREPMQSAWIQSFSDETGDIRELVLHYEVIAKDSLRADVIVKSTLLLDAWVNGLSAPKTKQLIEQLFSPAFVTKKEILRRQKELKAKPQMGIPLDQAKAIR